MDRLLITLFFHALILVVKVGGSGATPERRVISIEPSGRVIEEYNTTAMIGVDDDIRQRYGAQIELDRSNDEFTPNRTDLRNEKTPLGYLRFGPVVYRGHYSTVHTIDGYPDIYIKYQAHCARIDEEIHPLLRDAWYTNETNRYGMAPKIIFVSPPSLLCEIQDGKCDFTMPVGDLHNCHESMATMRYMIMERVNGMSLHQYRRLHYSKSNGAIPFADAMIIGYHLIYQIRKLHLKTKIIHGDIHSPNVLMKFSNSSIGAFELVFIDFGTASKILNGPVSSARDYPRGRVDHELRTQWQMDGYEWTERDDVMKAIQTMAQIMHTFEYFELEAAYRARGYSGLRDWKMNHFWFIPTLTRNPLTTLNITAEKKDEIRQILFDILQLARSMLLNRRPPYEELLSLISQCFRIANESKDMLTTTTVLPTSTFST